MPMKIELEPKTASVKIGQGYVSENRITFTIRLMGNGPVWLRLQIPVGDRGVFRQAEDANDVTVATPGHRPSPIALNEGADTTKEPPVADTRESSVRDTKEWSLGDFDNGVQVSGSTELCVSISNILCRATVQTSEITVIGETNDSASDEIRAVLKVEKVRPQMIANPTVCSIAACVIAALAMVIAIWGAGGGVTATTKGWHEFYPLGKPDANGVGPFPSVIFDAGGRTDDALYAIFVRGGASGRKAVLCKSADGIKGWHVIADSVPSGMESSPGVQLGNRLWLIGGSAVDPAQISNRICYYDLGNTRGGWRDASVEGFDDGARMGHACVILNDKDHDKAILVLGGQGKYKCLNDVWSLTIDADGETVSAKRLANTSAWSPRCMFSAVNFNRMIWVCGGVSSPNGNPLGDLWVTNSSNISTDSNDIPWKRSPDGSGSVVANAIGTGAAACGGTLYTLITIRTGGPDWRIEPAMWTIGKLGMTTSSNSWTKSIHTPECADGSLSAPHSLAIVGFNNSLYCRRLYRSNMYGEAVVVAPLYVYVKP